MQKVIAIAAGGAVAAAVLIYLSMLNTDQAAPPSPPVMQQPMLPPVSGGAMPAGHPPMPAQPATPPPAQGALPPNHPPASGPPPVRDGLRQAPRAGLRFAQFKVGNRNVKAMLADGDTVWVGTSGGVIRYNSKLDQYDLYDVHSGLLSNGVFHLSKWRGDLVVGTYGGGLSILDLDTGNWRNYNIQHGLADAFIYDFIETQDGDLWIATWSGANRVLGGRLDDPEAWETYTVENTAGGLPNDWVYGLDLGKSGEVWMATEGGLARFKDGEWQNWNHDRGLGAPYELVKDDIQFSRDPAKESSHHARQKAEMGLTDVSVAYNPNYIVALHVDDDGAVWAGTWGGGLNRFDGENWRYYTQKDGLPANHVFMVGEATNGRMWVGTSHGLARFDGERFATFTVHDGLIANNVFSMSRADDGSLWLGSFGGVTRFVGIDQVE